MKLRYRILSVIAVLLTVGIASAAIYVSHDAPCTTPDPVPEGTAAMDAIVLRCYGTADVLELARVEKPTPSADEVLVKVHHAAINPLEWHYMTGTPYIMRTSAGFGAPENRRLGVDFAGTVEHVGKNVARFKPGDRVFGSGWGTFAEYVSIGQNSAVVPLPAEVSFEEAATLPIAGTTALQAVRDHGRVRAGQKVLINGASGGVGTFAVQLAKSFGAEVTGVCSTRNLDLVRSLGADDVVDYTRDDFTQRDERYDVVIDNVGNRDLMELKKVLKPNGKIVIVGAPKGGRWIAPLWNPLKAAIARPFLDEEIGWFIAETNQEDLKFLVDHISAGTLRPVIDRSYTLDEVPDAMRYLQTWRARGKILIEVSETSTDETFLTETR
jgi:NADPH:quinone reductase-like Zn-dependent oxidoreductase